MNGHPRTNLAYIRPDQTMDELWQPSTDGPVQELVVIGRTVYVAGEFSLTSGQSRSGLAALDAIAGAVLPWQPALPEAASIHRSLKS